jgi:hypothetical protein
MLNDKVFREQSKIVCPRNGKKWPIIQGFSRLYVMTAGDDFLGRCDEKIHINMCPILDGYGVMRVF